MLIIPKFPSFLPQQTILPQDVRLEAKHSAPYPTLESGYSATPRIGFAPFLRYAFTFSPYKYGSFFITIPHCISNAAAPVAKGAANEVPVTGEYPPSLLGARTPTPGATRSGFTNVSEVRLFT